MATSIRKQCKYDHRLKNLVRRIGDQTIASRIGVPRSTLDGWLSSRPTEVISIDAASMSKAELKAKIVRLERQCEVLRVVVRLLFVLIRVTGGRLDLSALTTRPSKHPSSTPCIEHRPQSRCEPRSKSLAFHPLDSLRGEEPHPTAVSITHV